MATSSPLVLISYTHDSPQHKERVLHLANKLRIEGVDCHIDQYEPFPVEGWPRWMARKLEDSDFIIVICTETYNRRFESNEDLGKGFGAQWEGFLITQALYEGASRNERFIPVLFSTEDIQFVPKVLRPSTFFVLDEQYEDLYRLLTEQPEVVKPELGERRVLPLISQARADSRDTTLYSSTTVRSASNRSSKSSDRDLTNLLLIVKDEHNFAFIPAARIKRGSEISLEVVPDDPHDSAFLAGLDYKFHKPQMIIVFGNNAVPAQLRAITTVHEGGAEIWHLSLAPSAASYNSPMAEFNFNGVAPEEIAEFRARRILLNDKSKFRRGGNRSENSWIEAMIGNGNGPIKRIVCPLPAVHEAFPSDSELFLAAGRLMCVMYLKLTGVVEHIIKLDLAFESDAALLVSFEGQRHARASNVPPHIIKFKGLCPLD